MSKKKSLFPHTTSTDPVTILRTVAKVIIAEPKRYGQEWWLNLIEKGGDADRFPACGTAACVAGWVVLTTTKDVSNYEVRNRIHSNMCDISPTATHILGLTRMQAGKLFDGFAIHRVWAGMLNDAGIRTKHGGMIDIEDVHADAAKLNGYAPVPRYGTALYAHLGVEHIRRFVRDNYGKDLGV